MNKTSSAVVRTLLLGTSCLTVLSLSAAKADPTGGTNVALGDDSFVQVTLTGTNTVSLTVNGPLGTNTQTRVNNTVNCTYFGTGKH